jgi:hypothetical protein
MAATDLASEIQNQVLSIVHTVQEGVVGTLEWVTEQAETRLPDAAVRFAASLPHATEVVDRGFDTVEQWLRSQHDFASKIADAVTPSQPRSWSSAAAARSAAAASPSA